MSQERLPPPPTGCLERRYPSTQKGGTLIVEEVVDREAHERRRADPDGYRPERCFGCGHDRLHIHDYPERKLRGEAGQPVIQVVRYWCPGCEGTWRMLPLFLARMLWRSWRVVEAETLGPPRAATEPAVPERTVRRWKGRLAMAALLAAQVLAVSGGAALERIAQQVGLEGTRLELVQSYESQLQPSPGQRLASLAAVLHRLAPGVRLM